MSLDKVEKKLFEIETLSKTAFPLCHFHVQYIRFNRFSARLTIEKKLFLDFYYNADNHRQNISLIRNRERIMGWDNLGGWHYHPLADPHKHLKCAPPALKKIFKVIKTAGL